MSKDGRDDTGHNHGMTDRRKRERILDGVSASSGIGSVGVGVYILSLLMNLGDVQKDHGRWIHENTKSNERVLDMLKEMNEEFRSDIRRFEGEHRTLQSGLRELELQNATAGTRLMSLENMVLNPNFAKGAWSQKQDDQALKAFEVDLKEWLDENFQRRGSK